MPHLIRKTKNLIIRPLKYSDFKEWKTAHLEMLPPQNKWDRGVKKADQVSLNHFKKILKEQKDMRLEDKFYDLSVFEKKTGRLVGAVAAMDIHRGLGQSAYLGYRIYNRYWGKGYGKESTLAMVDISFRDIKLHRLEAGIEKSNRRSILLARAVGLRKEGFKKKAVYLGGKWIDLVVYAVTCEDMGIKWKGIPKSRLR